MQIRVFITLTVALFASMSPASALVVTNTADSGAGSLRQAVIDAAATDTITFDGTLSGQTIVLTTGQLTVSKNLTIDASALAGGITIDGNANGRIFETQIFSFSTTVLEGLTLTNGLASEASTQVNRGGAIYVNENTSLILNNSTLSGNSAMDGGGIYNEGDTLTLNHCTLSGNSATIGAGGSGGGIYNRSFSFSGMLTLNECTISGNSAFVAGGGIHNELGTIGIHNSTLSDNSTYHYGGGICNYSTITITNSTLSGNSTSEFDGGGICNNGTLTITCATISGNSAINGGGISNSGTLNCTNSIVAGNTAILNQNLAGSITAGSNNLADVDPQLAPLGNYGGPTRTMPPLPGSPAIEGGVLLGSTPLTDQRGTVRPSGPLPDIGAVEAFPLASAPGFVDTDSDGIDDRLETGVFGNLATANATSDFDGDGSSDKDELANMTNPLDSMSLFKVLSMAKTINFNPAGNAEFELTFSTFPGLGYQLETSNTLAGFQQVPGSTFTADGFTKTVTVVLDDIRGFVRASRQD